MKPSEQREEIEKVRDFAQKHLDGEGIQAKVVIYFTPFAEHHRQLADSILKNICIHFDVSVSAVKSGFRGSEIVLVRQVIASVLIEVLGLKQKQVGVILGGRSHSTIIHAKTTMYERMETEIMVEAAYQQGMEIAIKTIEGFKNEAKLVF